MGIEKILCVFHSFFNSEDRHNKEKEVNSAMSDEFLNSICFEEDPFEGEIPENVRMFDLDGNEVES